jgi:hypothetical protein
MTVYYISKKNLLESFKRLFNVLMDSLDLKTLLLEEIKTLFGKYLSKMN